MKPSLISLSRDAIQAGAFFQRDEQVDSLPFVHSFPKSSCELVSAFLSIAIERKYAESSIKVAKAYSRANNDWHFWIEVGDFVVDATAHQFTEYKHPLICPCPSPLETRFPDVDRIAPNAALRNLGSLSETLKKSIVTRLTEELFSKAERDVLIARCQYRRT